MRLLPICILLFLGTIQSFNIVIDHECASGSLKTHQAVTFTVQPEYAGELSISSLSHLTNPVVTFDFGDSTEPLSTSITEKIDHFYNDTGSFHIRAYIHSTTSAAVNSQASAFLTQSAQYFYKVTNATMWTSKVVHVSPGHCSTFEVYSTVNRLKSKVYFSTEQQQLVSGLSIATYDVYIGIVSLGEPSASSPLPSSSSSLLTKEFISLGEVPNVIAEQAVKGMKNYYVKVLDPVQIVDDLWKVSVVVSTALSSIVLSVNSNGVTSLGCTIEDSKFHIRTLVKEKKPSTDFTTHSPAALSLSAAAPLITKFAFNPCNPSIMIGYYLKNATSLRLAGFSSKAVLSYNGFESNTDVYDVSWWGFTVNEYILHVQILEEKIFVVTTNGFYFDNLWASDGSFTSPLQHISNPGLIPSSTASSSISGIYTSMHCPTVFSESSGIATQAMYIHLSASILFAVDWTSGSFVNLNVPVASSRILSITRDVLRKNHIFLLSSSSTGGESVAVMTDDDRWKITYTFPSGTRLTNLQFDIHGTRIYAFGSTLWSSVDGGLATWEKHDISTNRGSNVLSGGISIFLNSISFSATQRSFVLFDSVNYNVYYGRADVRKKMILLQTRTWPLLTNNTMSYGVFFDALGRLKSLSFYHGGTPSHYLSDIPIESFIDSQNIYLPNISVVTKVSLGATMIRSWSNGIRGVSGAFSKGLTGMILNTYNGGRVRIDTVSENGDFATGQVLSSMAACTTALCASLAATKDLNVSITTLESTNGYWTAYLCLSSNSYGWSSQHVGMTVKFAYPRSVILIENFLNTSCVKGWLFEYNIGLTTSFQVHAGSWFLVDSRPKFAHGKNLAVSITTAGTNFSSIPGVLKARFASPQNFKIGHILAKSSNSGLGHITTSDPWAWILEPLVDPSEFLILVRNGFTAGTSFTTTDGVFVTESPKSHLQEVNAPLPIIRTIWNFTMEECEFTKLTPIENGLHVLDNEDSFSLNTLIKYRDGFIPTTRSGLRLHVLNKYLLTTNILVNENSIFGSFSSTSAMSTGSVQNSDNGVTISENTNQIGKFTVEMRPRGSNVGVSVLIMEYPRAVLKCPASDHVVHINTNCPSTKELFLDIGFSDPDFLNDFLNLDRNRLDSTGTPMFEDLPINYRPPSHLGRGVPDSSTVYNADPTQSLGFIENKAAEFKQCVPNQPSSACGCTQQQRLSQFIKDSECSQRAMRSYFGKMYAPLLKVRQEGQAPTKLVEKYRIYDLNNRTDYCFNFTSTGCDSSLSDETRRKLLASVLLDPTKADAITFYSDGFITVIMVTPLPAAVTSQPHHLSALAVKETD
eukprot:g1480.t1